MSTSLNDPRRHSSRSAADRYARHRLKRDRRTRLGLIVSIFTIVASAAIGQLLVTPRAPSDEFIVNPGFEQGLDAQGDPTGWYQPKPCREAGFRLRLEAGAGVDGSSCARLSFVRDGSPDSNTFGNVMQGVRAQPLRGKRVRMSASLATVDVEPRAGGIQSGGAGLWFRVDRENGASGAFDNMMDRAVTGTTDWKTYEVVADVDEDAEWIAFGMLLAGSGEAFVDDFQFEVVGEDVTPTTMEVSEPGTSKPRLPRKADRAELQRASQLISDDVAQIRGLSFKRVVNAEYRSPEETQAYFSQVLNEEIDDSELRAAMDVSALFGYVEDGYDMREAMQALSLESIAGFYDFRKSKNFFLVCPYDGGFLGEVVAAHELCHALEDQHFPLTEMLNDTEVLGDRSFAIAALVEGSATTLQVEYTRRRVAAGVDVEGMSDLLDPTSDPDSLLNDVPSAYLYMMGATYTLGSQFLSGSPFGFPAPDLERWNAAWDSPPLSSEQILHPEKYWDPAQRDDPIELLLGDHSASLSESWSLRDEDRAGEFSVFVVTTPELLVGGDPLDLDTISSLPGHNAASAGWGGDRYQLYRNDDGERVLLWASIWDSESDREEFLDEIVSVQATANTFFHGIHASEEQHSDRAVVLFADAGATDEADRLLAELLRSSPEWR